MDHLCTEMCPWLLPAIFRLPLCIKDPITVMRGHCHEKIYFMLGFTSCHTPFGQLFALFAVKKKNLQCFFHCPEPFLIRAVTAHLYLRRIFSHTKKGSVLIDALHLLSMLRSPTIWLKLTSIRNDKNVQSSRKKTA